MNTGILDSCHCTQLYVGSGCLNLCPWAYMQALIPKYTSITNVDVLWLVDCQKKKIDKKSPCLSAFQN